MSYLLNPFTSFPSGGASVPSPEIEYDGPSLLGADGTDITQWDDISGNARHGIGAVGNEPIVKTGILNGHPIARWNPATDFGFNFTGNGVATSFTIIAVLKATSTGTRTILSEATGGSNAPEFRLNTSNFLEFVQVGVEIIGTSSTALNTTSFYTVALTYDDVTGPGNWAFYLNGSADGSGTSDENWGVRFSRVGYRAGNLNRFSGDMAYVAYWNTVLSGGDLTTKFNALRTKYAHY